ncbi:hypothetical protein [Vibrio ziniensis]|uniref:Uncharacterized protein n=1 Tax=Vibrio ziniensis TaxID=2711221 RepID=A0A6G7CMK9_9VIBR|nr:hypothetical protein [Vibrio ziniensis]QIH43314.1 hypothetical protein G5S32_15010 [Vibrio ziniensis]
MDTQPSQSKKTDDKLHELSALKENENSQSSRFSRRRFIQSGIAASPLLMSVKSPVAWAADNLTNSSAAVSGNTSTSSELATIAAINPTTWGEIINGNDSFLKNALTACGIKSNTHFLDMFGGELCSLNSCNESGWSYKILTNTIRKSDNPLACEALQNASACKLVLRVQKYNNSSPVTGDVYGSSQYSIQSSNNKHCFDVSIYEPELHKNLICGYLNGLFSSDFIEYPFDQVYIFNTFKSVISSLADRIAKDGHEKNFDPSIYSLLPSLRYNLSQTWK